MLFDLLQLHGRRCVALLGAGGKTTLQTLLEPESARNGSGCIFYEAETTGGKCLALHEPGPLRLRPGTDCAIVVAGLGALGWPIRDVCARYELRRAFAAEPDRLCDPHDLLAVVRENLQAAGLPKEQLRVLLNQADTGALHVQASDILRALQADGYSATALSLLM